MRGGVLAWAEPGRPTDPPGLNAMVARGGEGEPDLAGEALAGVGRVWWVDPFRVVRGLHAGRVLAGALPGAGEEAHALLGALGAQARAAREPRQRVGLRLRFGGKLRDVDATAVPLAQPLPDAD